MGSNHLPTAGQNDHKTDASAQQALLTTNALIRRAHHIELFTLGRGKQVPIA